MADKTALQESSQALFCAIAAAAATRATFLRVEPLFRPRTYLQNPGSTFTGPIQLQDGTIELGPGQLFVLKDPKVVVSYQRDSVEVFASEEEALNEAAPGGPDQEIFSDGWVGQRVGIVQRGHPDQVLREREHRAIREAYLKQREEKFKCVAREGIQERRAPIEAKKASAAANLAQVQGAIAQLDPQLELIQQQIAAFGDKKLIDAERDLQDKNDILDVRKEPCNEGEKPKPKTRYERAQAALGLWSPPAAKCPTPAVRAADIKAAQDDVDAAQAVLDKNLNRLKIKDLDKDELERNQKDLKDKKANEVKAKNRLEQEIAADDAKLVVLENEEKKIPQEAAGKCAKVAAGKKRLANQVPVGDVQNPAPGGKFGKPFLKLGDLEPIDACPAGFKHDAAQFA
jgi:hypothetical protein